MEQVLDCLYVKHYELFSTNCPVLITGDRMYLMDTFMGPLPMRELMGQIHPLMGKSELVVLNSHSHFDHVWGNGAFPGIPIVSHERCREIMEKEGESVLRELGSAHPEWVMGEVEITLPSVTFTGSLVFHDRGRQVRLEHFPGHSGDSIIVLASPGNICLAGDSVEDPFPLLQESSEQANIDCFLGPSET
jgi:glyoxylase-like metal-dependent hydrolase (beta-lactamase superfamily II)